MTSFLSGHTFGQPTGQAIGIHLKVVFEDAVPETSGAQQEKGDPPNDQDADVIKSTTPHAYIYIYI